MRIAPKLVFAGALSLAGLGCTDTTSVTDHAVVTSVAVHPAEFLGTLTCGPNAGAVQAYTAEVVDRDTGVSLATSPPVSCTLPVAFEQVEEDHTYFAKIRVFDLPPTSVDATTPSIAETTCGVDEGYAIVNADERAFIHGCIPLSGTGTSTTAIDIDTAALVTKLGCSTEGGAIESLRVSAIDPPAGSLPDVVIACGQGPVSYASSGSGGVDLAPNAAYHFVVRAFAPGGATDAAYVASCSAQTIDGVRVDAACSPLSSYGTIRIDAASILASASTPLVCGEAEGEVATYDVVFDAGTPAELGASGVSCTLDAVVGPVEAGDHGGEVTLRDANGKRVGHAICFVDAMPGVTVTAPCVSDSAP